MKSSDIALDIYDLLKRPNFSDGADCEEIMLTLNISRFKFYEAIRYLLLNKVIIRVSSKRPVKYKLIKPILS